MCAQCLLRNISEGLLMINSFHLLFYILYLLIINLFNQILFKLQSLYELISIFYLESVLPKEARPSFWPWKLTALFKVRIHWLNQTDLLSLLWSKMCMYDMCMCVFITNETCESWKIEKLKEGWTLTHCIQRKLKNISQLSIFSSEIIVA